MFVVMPTRTAYCYPFGHCVLSALLCQDATQGATSVRFGARPVRDRAALACCPDWVEQVMCGLGFCTIKPCFWIVLACIV